MNKSIKQRLLKSLAAQSFAQVVNLTIQLFSIPLFLRYWNSGLYGEWLIISTIPSYMALSDLGFGSAAATDMTLRVARGDKKGAIAVYQTVWLLITCISAAAMLGFFLFFHFAPLNKLFNLTIIRPSEAGVIVTLLIMQVFIALQQGLMSAGFRCDGNYAWGVTAGNCQRLSEFLAGALVLSLHGGPVALASVVLAVGVISNVLIRLSLRRLSPWLSLGWRFANRSTLREIAGPAFAYMGFPLGHALSLQGVVMLIGIILGPAAVVIFSTTRTLTRFILQIPNLVTNTVSVELTVALSVSNYDLARSLHRRACQISLWLTFLISSIFYLTGEHIYGIWTKGKLQFDHLLFALLIFNVLNSSVWSSSYMVSMAINKHQKIAVVYLTSTAISLVFSIMLTRWLGLAGAAISLLLIDAAMNFYVVKSSLAIVKDNFEDFLRSIAVLPVAPIIHLVGTRLKALRSN